MFHNEALQVLDAVVSAAVEGLPSTTPPASPAIGSCYIVGTSPTGAWSGQAHKLAAFTGGGWRFVAPVEGLGAVVRSNGSAAVYRNVAWEIGKLRGSEVAVDGLKVVGAREAAIAAPAGGSTVDAEARTAIGAILAAMRGHGLIET